ncbi:CRISPR-associated endonuclease Cas3'' [Acetobacter sp. DsW_063]|uniref:CRISPR-associated endonuclease Cas3'' n=1 Tax=Acetobacter sp. DsW_063 TaxID=1514894 RepID=UPI000A3788F4|nr:CRISPR-associated endonuclease Cas3'' [Acetobacter sp. DsW_063]OUJ17131.1 helicase [Acetobacter sp. DsW_063]
MQRFAHSVPGQPEENWEPLSDHLSLVSRFASTFATAFGAQDIAQTMGLLHDIGKVSLPYQFYIRNPPEAGSAKGPDHSSAGAQEAIHLYGEGLGRLMAFGIAGHHAGLMDSRGHGMGNLQGRLSKEIENYQGWQDYVGELPAPDTLKNFLKTLRPNGIDPTFSPAFLIRMLFSCLVDADFLATEHFLANAQEGVAPPRGGQLTSEHLDIVRAHLRKHRRADSPVNRLRSQILDHANGKAFLPPGLFTLTVPTGGGKTLTSLSFAMEHATIHNLRRIVYVIPYTSIIEQTAQIFREDVGLGDDVLEHHSSFDWDRQAPTQEGDAESEGPAGLAKLRRDAQNWNAPVIVTTSVQFFESLFAARTSQARKLHNLARSVIILDEAQSMPVHLLRPCMAVIDELAKNYGASVILCTATQPALRSQDGALPLKQKKAHDGPDIPDGLEITDDRELAPDPRQLYERLRRVAVEWPNDAVDDPWIASRFAEQRQMLCIVNSRAHARDLFNAIREQEGAFHLTTLMCARHRRAALAKIRSRLASGAPARLVATSLIEAGVDVSFPEVWRAAAGLSNIAQAAGRCNRSGELGELGRAFGRVVVFEPAETSGRPSMPRAMSPFYQAAKNARRVIERDENADILGLEAIRDYYRWLYWDQGHVALDKARSPDGSTVAIMEEIRDTCRKLDFPFARIAEAFHMIDDVMDPVIVKWDDEARAAVESLHNPTLATAAVQRRLQQYVVPVPSVIRTALLGSGAVQAIRPDLYGDRFVVLESESLYDPMVGLRLDDPTWRSSESNVM